MSNKKNSQLGMNYSTASNRLVKDILWSMIVETGKEKCCKCGLVMDRGSFTIEHIVPWLDSNAPKTVFFDLANIGFSHAKCNFADRRKGQVSFGCGTAARYRRGCRCDRCRLANSVQSAKYYTKEGRRERFLQTGK